MTSTQRQLDAMQQRVAEGSLPAGPADRELTEMKQKLIVEGASKVLFEKGFGKTSIRDIAAKTLEGVVPDSQSIVKLSDDEIVARLTEVRGVGRWTVEMLLIFQLGRPDVLPVDDYGLRTGFKIVFKKRELPAPRDILSHGERWRPYRTTASWYLWQAANGIQKKK